MQVLMHGIYHTTQLTSTVWFLLLRTQVCLPAPQPSHAFHDSPTQWPEGTWVGCDRAGSHILHGLEQPMEGLLSNANAKTLAGCPMAKVSNADGGGASLP